MAGADDKNLLTNAGSWLGVLVAGLAGAFTFVGLSGDELATVLRNEGAATTWVFLLLTLTVVVAVVSVFEAGKTFDRLYAVSLALLALAPLALTPALVSVPATSEESKVAAWIMGGALLVAGIVLLVVALRNRKKRGRKKVAAQPFLVVGSVLLLAAGVWAGVRAEVRSQSSTTHVQLEPALTVDDHGASLKVAIAVSKLPVDNFVIVTVYGVERSRELTLQRPCVSQLSHEDCEFIAGYVLNPDAVGRVDDHVSLRIDDVRFQHVALTGQTCKLDASAESEIPVCEHSNRGGKVTTVDLRIPAPPRPA